MRNKQNHVAIACWSGLAPHDRLEQISNWSDTLFEAINLSVPAKMAFKIILGILWNPAIN